ncbi:MAG TPA: glycine zipper 2TM domain-containing protein [Gammaproteobacteria bacterium]|nr:glycine zipper 2TM domain-containing protein [Gammaproteobacteria bacterium]
MKRTTIGTAVLCSAIALGGCADYGRQEQAGMVIGGALGGLLGSQVSGKHNDWRTAAIIAGTMAGAAIGGSIGRTMDEVDRMKTAQTLEAVRTGVPSTWRNPDTGIQYTVTPTRTTMTPSGPCRDYTINALIEGRQETVRGTACRQPDGSWRTK